jgi:hypothetical protein
MTGNCNRVAAARPADMEPLISVMVPLLRTRWHAMYRDPQRYLAYFGRFIRAFAGKTFSTGTACPKSLIPPPAIREVDAPQPQTDDGVGHPAPGLSAAVPRRRWRAQMQVDGPLAAVVSWCPGRIIVLSAVSISRHIMAAAVASCCHGRTDAACLARNELDPARRRRRDIDRHAGRGRLRAQAALVDEAWRRG